MTRSPRQRPWLRGAGLVAVVLALLALLVPLVWPVPPLEDTVPPQQLADEASRFAEIDGINLHYKTWGWDFGEQEQDSTTAFVLLHGFGASTFSWEPVAEELAQTLPVVAFDRPGFGLTERPIEWSGDDPYSPETQARLTIGLMDEIGVSRAVLIGHSAGGTVAALIAAEYPDRVAAVVFEDPAIFAGGPPRFLTPLFRTPQFMRLGPLFVRGLAGDTGTEFLQSAWHDPSEIPDATYQGYRTPLRAQDWDRALWQLTIAPRPRDVPGILETVEAPSLFITGDDDRIVPPEDTRSAAALVEGSQLVVIEDCGHIPHEERPNEFLRATLEFVGAQSFGTSGP